MSGLHVHGASATHSAGHRHSRDSHNRDSGATTTKAAIASVGVALFLLILKAYAAAQTGSVAMLGS
ncbi:MAG: CDF family cation-efflux transporter FieF, partial [Sphingorhabdus sp.]|nr:CDF family cation-efflux transporter FieF [Sphingorhabdus sp.]